MVVFATKYSLQIRQRTSRCFALRAAVSGWSASAFVLVWVGVVECLKVGGCDGGIRVVVQERARRVFSDAFREAGSPG